MTNDAGVLPPLTPTDEQEHHIEMMLNAPTKGRLLASEMGTGKSLVVVEFLVRLNPDVVLIICPLGTRGNARRGWEGTLRRQGWTKPIRRIEAGKAGTAALDDLKAKVPGVYLVGREKFRRMTWTKIKPDVAIYDETQGGISNRNSVGYERIKGLSATWRVALSGTFYGNKFAGAWPVCRWLWPKDEKPDMPEDAPSYKRLYIDNSFWRWAAENCIVVEDYFAGKVAKAEKVPGRFVNSLPCYIRAEWKSKRLPWEDLTVELTRAQRRIYDDIERDGLAWLGEHPLVTSLPITIKTRLRQATLGELTYDANHEINFADDCKSSKIDALKEWLSYNDDETVIIATDSKKFAKVVAKRIEGARLWDGDTPQDERERLIAGFGKDFKYLVCSIAAVGAGIDGLQERCHTFFVLSETEDNVLNQQFYGRLDRTGQQHPVRMVRVLATDSYDEGIFGKNMATELANRQSMKKEES